MTEGSAGTLHGDDRQRAADPLSDVNRALPYSDDAEKGVLSCFLQNPVDLLADAQCTLPPEAFYHPVNRQIYEELLAFNNRPDQKALDLVTFSQHLIDKGLMDKIGGPAFIAELLSFVPTPAHYPYYRGILRDKLLLRQIIKGCTNGIQWSYEYQENTTELLDKVQREVLSINHTRTERGPAHVKEAVAAAVDNIQHMLLNVGSVSGTPCGLADLDRTLNGFEKKDRIVIGARPSVGKTSLLMNIAEHLCLEEAAPGLIFSLDGDAMNLMKRGIAGRSRVSLIKLRAGMVSRQDQKDVMMAAKDWQAAPLYIDDRPGLTIHQMASAARRLKKSAGIQWVAADFFQNVRSPGKGDRDPRIELNEVSQMWMNLVMELEIFGIMLAQLNREADRGGGRPKMADLKECGKIEEDASKIVLMSNDWRDWDKIKDDDDIDEKDRQKAPAPRIDERFVIADVVKNKDGPTGPIWLRLNAPITRFSSFVPDKPLYRSSYNKDERAKRHAEVAPAPTAGGPVTETQEEFP